MITIPLDTSFSDSVVYREVFDYLKKNVAPEFKGERRYSWFHYSKDNETAEVRWSVITAPPGRLSIEIQPQEHETFLALKYGTVERKSMFD